MVLDPLSGLFFTGSLIKLGVYGTLGKIAYSKQNVIKIHEFFEGNIDIKEGDNARLDLTKMADTNKVFWAGGTRIPNLSSLSLTNISQSPINYHKLIGVNFPL